MKNALSKTIQGNIALLLMITTIPSHAMMKRFTSAAQIVHRSLHAARSLQPFTYLSRVQTAPAVLAATHRKYSKDHQQLLPYLAAGVVGATTLHTAYSEKKDEQPSQDTVWLEKSNTLLHFSPIPTEHMAPEDRELLYNEFGSLFTTGLEDFLACVETNLCMRAYIVTPSGRTLAAIALFKRYTNSPEIIFVSFLVTHPDHQKKGIATALLNHLARSTKTSHILLNATTDAYPFYLHIGFESMTGECCTVKKEFKQ